MKQIRPNAAMTQNVVTYTVVVAWLNVLALWIAWGSMTADWLGSAHCRHAVTLRPDRPVVCLGDSMTSLGLFGGYPQDLQRLISLPVVNRGRSLEFHWTPDPGVNAWAGERMQEMHARNAFGGPP